MVRVGFVVPQYFSILKRIWSSNLSYNSLKHQNQKNHSISGIWGSPTRKDQSVGILSDYACPHQEVLSPSAYLVMKMSFFAQNCSGFDISFNSDLSWPLGSKICTIGQILSSFKLIFYQNHIIWPSLANHGLFFLRTNYLGLQTTTARGLDEENFLGRLATLLGNFWTLQSAISFYLVILSKSIGV